MKVVILCGGAGTRLSELTDVQPKPMVSIGGRPILWHIMKLYSHYGSDDFVLCLGYRGETIRSYFANYSHMNSDLRVHIGDQRIEVLEPLHDEARWTVTLAETGDDTPTGGRIRRVAKYVGRETFMATYGDGVSNVDIPALVEHHLSRGRLATVTGVRPLARFGELRVEGDRVVEFREKPALRKGSISAGFFVFEPEVFEYLGETSVLEREPLERLAAEGQLTVYQHEGYWHPMDTLRDVRELNEEWRSGRAPWKVWPR